VSDWRVSLTEVSLSDREVEAVMETLRSGWLTMGPRTQELEGAFAARLGMPHAAAVSSGSAAVHLVLLAAGIGPGDEVIVPGMSYVADAHAPRLCGATPVFADSLSPDVPSMDPDDVAGRITARTRAVIAVHMFGYPVAIEALEALCAERGLMLIEDCAEALGAELPGGEPVGTRGLAGCFSFFSKTQLGVGEGGMVVSRDGSTDARVRSLRSHAMTSVTWDRHRGHAQTYDVTDLGFNYRIDETRASLALARLGHLDERVAGLRRVVGTYRTGLADVDGVEPVFGDDQVERAGHFAFPVLVRDRDVRDAARTRLQEHGIQTTFYPSITQLSAYASGAGGGCPVAEEFADRHLALPLFPTLDDERIDIVVGELRESLAG
jgi:dTDP-4-amino-4,6-dideoxygalactose transaminase